MSVWIGRVAPSETLTGDIKGDASPLMITQIGPRRCPRMPDIGLENPMDGEAEVTLLWVSFGREDTREMCPKKETAGLGQHRGDPP